MALSCTWYNLSLLCLLYKFVSLSFFIWAGNITEADQVFADSFYLLTSSFRRFEFEQGVSQKPIKFVGVGEKVSFTKMDCQ